MTRALVAVCCAAAAWASYAAPFADPTRPPRASSADAAAPAAGPRLESVLIAPDRRVAVISGQQVTLGSRFAGGEVVRITETEVRIRRPTGDQVLKLFTGETRPPSVARKGN